MDTGAAEVAQGQTWSAAAVAWAGRHAHVGGGLRLGAGGAALVGWVSLVVAVGAGLARVALVARPRLDLEAYEQSRADVRLAARELSVSADWRRLGYDSSPGGQWHFIS